jgi:DNA-3-methyladenine glycosylase
MDQTDGNGDMSVLPRQFFNRETLIVCRELLGTCMIRENSDGSRLYGMISETEAYTGEEDTASHAHKGRTARNRVMYGPPGHAYIYLIYGIHSMLNVVTEPTGFPGAVLIRALVPLQDLYTTKPGDIVTTSPIDGPAKVCKALAIDRSLNTLDMCHGETLWMVPGYEIPQMCIHSGPRIGLSQRVSPADRHIRHRFWINMDNLPSGTLCRTDPEHIPHNSGNTS